MRKNPEGCCLRQSQILHILYQKQPKELEIGIRRRDKSCAQNLCQLGQIEGQKKKKCKLSKKVKKSKKKVAELNGSENIVLDT